MQLAGCVAEAAESNFVVNVVGALLFGTSSLAKASTRMHLPMTETQTAVSVCGCRVRSATPRVRPTWGVQPTGRLRPSAAAAASARLWGWGLPRAACKSVQTCPASSSSRRLRGPPTWPTSTSSRWLLPGCASPATGGVPARVQPSSRRVPTAAAAVRIRAAAVMVVG
jgi:hypothetical protein